MRVFIASDGTHLGASIERRFARSGAAMRTFAVPGSSAIRAETDRASDIRLGAATSVESDVALAARDGSPDVCIDVLGATTADADADALGSALTTSVAFARACVKAMLAGRGGTMLMISTPGATPEATALRAAFQAQFTLNLRADLHGTRVRVMMLRAAAALAPLASPLAGGLDGSDASGSGDAGRAAETAEAAWWLAARPPHVVVNALELEWEPSRP